MTLTSTDVINGAEITVEQLAEAADLPVSTIRMYQNRGLLPPPTKRGRVAYYGRQHVGRLNLVARLQDRGFSLAGIKELIDGMESGESLRAVLGLSDTPSTWTPEEPETLALPELAGFLPQVDFTPEMVKRIVDLGLVEFTGGIDVTVRSPSFLRVGSELAALGVPPSVILDQYELLRDDAERIAGRFTDVFRTYMWLPFVEAGMPADQLTDVINGLEKLGPLAEGVVVMSLRHALQDLAETFIEAEADRLDIDIPRPGAGATPA